MSKTANAIVHEWTSHATVEGITTQEEMIGQSTQLRRVLDQASIVGATDSTVLVLGETGTGKGRVAKIIHDWSERRRYAFVKVNCAAIPLGLLESELFGHERGAFTGAIAQRIGRFELANRGTLFLDEIGDIPGELQPKLLRVLQEQEFERLGSTHTIKTDIRLIAATHQNLRKLVAEGRFREDLYYRLNVFPITMPPLRERREDLPALIRHFVHRFAQRMNRKIEVIPEEVVERLTRYRWPGNIRELENFLERAVILSKGAALEPPVHELAALEEDDAAAPVTLRDAERAHISKTLREVEGVTAAAAIRLGLPRSTLFYKMRRLGITAMREEKRRPRQQRERAPGAA
jgi:formate hydrogenlyase transcriptional activator